LFILEKLTMDTNFWKNQQDFFCLAPMEDVTDTVFREVVLYHSNYKGLKVLFSEFLSTDGFCHPIGRNKVVHRLHINDTELSLVKKNDVKLVAQIWGTKPEKFYQTAQYIKENTAFDGIDINMGCPQKNIIKKGACSALINDPVLAQEIIQATAEATNLPVSVKTRIGFRSVDTHNWISHLLSTPIKALTIHGRTQRQMSDGLANWDEVAKAVELKNAINPPVKIIGNGDVSSISDGEERMLRFGTDGIMVGRGIFSDFWMFSLKSNISIEDKLSAMLQHARLYDDTWGNQKPWVTLRRFFKIYTYFLPQAAHLRDMVMRTNNLAELEQALKVYRESLAID
jgi:tRNA-dihydrouridine synthase